MKAKTGELTKQFESLGNQANAALKTLSELTIDESLAGTTTNMIDAHTYHTMAETIHRHSKKSQASPSVYDVASQSDQRQSRSKRSQSDPIKFNGKQVQSAALTGHGMQTDTIKASRADQGCAARGWRSDRRRYDHATRQDATTLQDHAEGGMGLLGLVGPVPQGARTAAN